MRAKGYRRLRYRKAALTLDLKGLSLGGNLPYLTLHQRKITLACVGISPYAFAFLALIEPSEPTFGDIDLTSTSIYQHSYHQDRFGTLTMVRPALLLSLNECINLVRRCEDGA